jgi:hypothetical protein
MEHISGYALNRLMRDSVVIGASEAMTREANRLRLHAVTIISPPEGYHPTTLEVAYALSQQLHVLRHNIRISRLQPGLFLADFMMSLERDHALCKGYIEAARSPPSYRQAGAREKEPMYCWAEDMEPMDHGRSWFRSPSRSAREMEYLQHAGEDWECRRSRSPGCQGHSWDN